MLYILFVVFDFKLHYGIVFICPPCKAPNCCFQGCNTNQVIIIIFISFLCEEIIKWSQFDSPAGSSHIDSPLSLLCAGGLQCAGEQGVSGADGLSGLFDPCRI